MRQTVLMYVIKNANHTALLSRTLNNLNRTGFAFISNECMSR